MHAVAGVYTPSADLSGRCDAVKLYDSAAAVRSPVEPRRRRVS